jgi:hypothetical protein
MTKLRVTCRNFANAPTRGTETQKERKENKITERRMRRKLKKKKIKAKK